MSQKSGTTKLSSERIVNDIPRATRKQYSAEEKIRIVLDGSNCCEANRHFMQHKADCATFPVPGVFAFAVPCLLEIIPCSES
jgi:hypothetical protein